MLFPPAIQNIQCREEESTTKYNKPSQDDIADCIDKYQLVYSSSSNKAVENVWKDLCATKIYVTPKNCICFSIQ